MKNKKNLKTITIFFFTSIGVTLLFYFWISYKILDYKISQMIMVGFNGTSIKKNSIIYDDIVNEHVGALILYGGKTRNNVNIESKSQVKKLCDDIKILNKDILIAIDEEGGKVSRLNQKNGFDKTKTAEEIASFNDVNKIRMWSKKIAQKLKFVGINLNLAPVVDLDMGGNSSALQAKGRCFSNNFKIVSRYAKVFIEEHRKNHIVTSLKHFPGYGSMSIDPHYDITDVTNTWKKKELEPYKILIKNNMADVIMTAHVFNRKLDKTYPATLSKNMIDNILRKKLKFDGVVISDDMLMGAITKKYGLEDAIVLAINAGVDILIFSKNNSPNDKYDSMVKYVKSVIRNAIKSKKISKERIEQSYNRIRLLKETIKK